MTEQWTCPDGHELSGVLEVLTGEAHAQPVWEDGRIVPEYEGYTDIDWNGQTPLLTDSGQRQWFCIDGDIHPESTLVREVAT